MARRYDTYGFGTLTIDESRGLVERRLGLDLHPRESSYYAETYYLHDAGSGRGLMLYRNLDAWGAPVNDDFAEHAVLLSVNDLDDMDDIRRRLTEGHEKPVILSSDELGDADAADSS
jgi:hypothetical protein